MTTIAEIRSTTDAKMNQSLAAFQNNLTKIRTGRANPALLDARTISVQPWEKGMGAKIEKAIRESDLGLNPSTTGDLIRVPMPALTEERRKDLTKVVRHTGEESKVAVRNMRRDANDQAKRLLKDKEITEDDERRLQDEVQKLTDRTIAEIDKLVQGKESEILAV